MIRCIQRSDKMRPRHGMSGEGASPRRVAGTPRVKGPTQGSKRGVKTSIVAALALAGTTALTTLVTWAITLASDSATDQLKSPVELTVQSDPTQTAVFSGEKQEAILPGLNSTAPNPSTGCRDLYKYSRAMGGADAKETRVHAFIRRSSPGTVVVTQAIVVVDERLPSLHGSHLSCSPEGELENRNITVNLDAAEPRINYESETGKPFGFSLEQGEVETFVIRASANRSLVRWHLELEVVEGTETRTIRVDDSGKPFATSAVTGRSWSWTGSSWQGVDASGRSIDILPAVSLQIVDKEMVQVLTKGLKTLLGLGLLLVSACSASGGAVTPEPPQESSRPTRTTLQQIRELNFINLPRDGGVASWSGTDHILYGSESDVFLVSLDGTLNRRLGSVHLGALELASDPKGNLVTAIGFDEITTWTSDGRGVRNVPTGIGEIGVVEYSDDGTIEVYASSVISTHSFEPDVTFAGEPAENDTQYQQLKIDGQQVVAWPGTDNSIDIWDISGAQPVRIQRQNCDCDAVHRAALARQAPLVAMTSDAGYLVMWNYRKNEMHARKVVADGPGDTIRPLAIIGDSLVLFTLSRHQADKRVTSPLMAWDVKADSVYELWNGPGVVSEIWPSNSGESVLMEVDREGQSSPTLWFGSIHTS